MNNDLTIEQSKKADNLLKKLLDKSGLGKETVDEFFKNDDETFFVCRVLEKMELVNLLGASYSQPFTILTSNGGIATLLENGGLTKIATDRENERNKKAERELKADKLMDLDLRLRTFESKIGKRIKISGFIILVLSFLITVLTLEFWRTDDNKTTQEPQVIDPQLNKGQAKLKDSLN